jgi:hypothetical protein
MDDDDTDRVADIYPNCLRILNMAKSFFGGVRMQLQGGSDSKMEMF